MKQIKNAVELGKLIKTLRKHAGLSQVDLAIRANLSRTAIQNLEKGKTTLQLSSLFPVVELLNIRIHLDHPLLKRED